MFIRQPCRSFYRRHPRTLSNPTLPTADSGTVDHLRSALRPSFADPPRSCLVELVAFSGRPVESGEQGRRAASFSVGNDNGKTDLDVTKEGSDTVSVLLNTCLP